MFTPGPLVNEPAISPGPSVQADAFTIGSATVDSESDATVAVDNQDEAQRKLSRDRTAPVRDRALSPVHRGRRPGSDERMFAPGPILPLSPERLSGKRPASHPVRQDSSTPRRRKTAQSTSNSPGGRSDAANNLAALSALQSRLAAQEGLRQADRDYADQVATARARQSELREKELRAEVARARTEALSQQDGVNAGAEPVCQTSGDLPGEPGRDHGRRTPPMDATGHTCGPCPQSRPDRGIGETGSPRAQTAWGRVRPWR